MKKFLILLLLLGCREPDNSCNMALQISDASEIQFWATGTSSFNLEQMGFTDDYCFHQKFLCSSQRKFQGYELDEVNDYYLIAFDEAGAELYNEMFDKTFPSLFLQALEDGENDTLAPDGPSHQPWTLGATPEVTIASPLGASALFLLRLYGAEADTNYNFDYDILRTFSVAGQVNMYVFDEAFTGGIPLGSFTTSLDVGEFNYTGVATVPYWLAVEVVNGGSGSSHAEINSITWQEQTATSVIVKHSLSLTPSDESMCDKFVTFKIFDGPDPETDNEIYYCDAIDFVSTWANSSSSGRVVIQFKSIQNFAGLLYDSGSGYFSIELEGRFRKERKITAQKSLELTEMVLNTAASVKKQRKLTIDDVSDYMHTKITLALAHAASGSVLVDGFEISVEESYDEGDRPESYPLTPADTWLTIKDYYKHNVI